MKKKAGLFIFSLSLATLALVQAPAPAEGARCLKPACFASPGCCIAQECTTWCASHGGGTPFCSGNGQGGCCSCLPPQG
jgi:hypothetical protein